MKRRLSYINQLADREIRDGEPCYYKSKFGDDGFKMYEDSVISSMSEFIMYEIPNFYNMEEDEEIERTSKTQDFLKDFLKDRIRDYYDNSEC